MTARMKTDLGYRWWTWARKKGREEGREDVCI